MLHSIGCLSMRRVAINFSWALFGTMLSTDISPPPLCIFVLFVSIPDCGFFHLVCNAGVDVGNNPFPGRKKERLEKARKCEVELGILLVPRTVFGSNVLKPMLACAGMHACSPVGAW